MGIGFETDTARIEHVIRERIGLREEFHQRLSELPEENQSQLNRAIRDLSLTLRSEGRQTTQADLDNLIDSVAGEDDTLAEAAQGALWTISRAGAAWEYVTNTDTHIVNYTQAEIESIVDVTVDSYQAARAAQPWWQTAINHVSAFVRSWFSPHSYEELLGISEAQQVAFRMRDGLSQEISAAIGREEPALAQMLSGVTSYGTPLLDLPPVFVPQATQAEAETLSPEELASQFPVAEGLQKAARTAENKMPGSAGGTNTGPNPFSSPYMAAGAAGMAVLAGHRASISRRGGENGRIAKAITGQEAKLEEIEDAKNAVAWRQNTAELDALDAKTASIEKRITGLNKRLKRVNEFRSISGTITGPFRVGIHRTQDVLGLAKTGTHVAARGSARAVRAIPGVGTFAGVAMGGGLATWVLHEGNKALQEELKINGALAEHEAWLQERITSYAMLENDPLVVFSIAGQKAIHDDVATQLGPELAQKLFPGTWFTDEELSYKPSHYAPKSLRNGAIYDALRSEASLEKGSKLQHPVSIALLDEMGGSYTALRAVLTGMEHKRNAFEDTRQYNHKQGHEVGTSSEHKIAQWEIEDFRGGLFDGSEVKMDTFTYGQLRRDLAGRGVLYQQMVTLAGDQADAMRIELYQLLVALNSDLRNNGVEKRDTVIVTDHFRSEYPLLTQALEAQNGRINDHAITLPAAAEVASFNAARESMEYAAALHEVTAGAHYPLIFTPSASKLLAGEKLGATDFEAISYKEAAAMLAFLQGAIHEDAPGDTKKRAEHFLQSYEDFHKEATGKNIGTNRKALEGVTLALSDYIEAAEEGAIAQDTTLDAAAFQAFLPGHFNRTFTIFGDNEYIQHAEKFDLPLFMEFMQTAQAVGAYQEVTELVAPDALDTAETIAYFAERPNYMYQAISAAEYIHLGGSLDVLNPTLLDRTGVKNLQLREDAKDLIEYRDTIMGNRTIKLRGVLDDEDLTYLAMIQEFAETLEKSHPQIVPHIAALQEAAPQHDDALHAAAQAAQAVGLRKEVAFTGVDSLGVPLDILPTLQAAVYSGEANPANTSKRPLGVVTGSEPVGVGSLSHA